MDEKEYKKLREDIINRALYIIERINQEDTKEIGSGMGMDKYASIRQAPLYEDILQVAPIILLLDISKKLDKLDK